MSAMKEMFETFIEMAARGKSDEEIAKATGLPVESIAPIRAEYADTILEESIFINECDVI